MSLVNLTVDGIAVQVESGSTILDAAKKAGVDIPTLCHYHVEEMGLHNQPASCRVCVVEVEKRRNLAPACATPVAEGMVVKTNTPKVMDERKTVVELMLSDHPKDCLTCPKSGDCELQKVSERLGIRKIRVTGKSQSTYPEDVSVSIVRNMDKCIMCRRCETVCNQVQTVGALSGVNRGFTAVVSTSFDAPLGETRCTFCGQCVQACPVGALMANTEASERLLDDLNNPEKVVIVNTAPAVRAALGEEFGLPAGTSVTGKMVTALRKIGFDHVFDTDFAADATIMEEAAELAERIAKYLKGEPVALPLMTSCCPAWVNFIESQYPEFLALPSSAKSPQQMFGAIAKNYFAEKLNVDRKNLVVVSVMPCIAKKFEASRPEFSVDGNADIDYSISTHELAMLIKAFNYDLAAMEPSEFDDPLGESTGAAVIFGKTGGVMEAALRTAYEWITGETLENVEFEDVRSTSSGIRRATVNIAGHDIHLAIASGLGNARKIMEEIKAGNPNDLHAVEIMACPGGCVNGGGQPYSHGNFETIRKRQQVLLGEDREKTIRKSHENPFIKTLYAEYMGQPGHGKAHELLHTTYQGKEKV